MPDTVSARPADGRLASTKPTPTADPAEDGAPGRLVVRYRAGVDGATGAAWVLGKGSLALDRCPLAEVVVSPVGITFLDRPVGPGELLAVAFSVPGQRDTWRCLARARLVTPANGALYRVATRIEAFAAGSDVALGGYARARRDAVASEHPGPQDRAAAVR